MSVILCGAASGKESTSLPVKIAKPPFAASLFMSNRLTWEEYAVLLADTASLRSQDPYKKVGACALRFDKSVASVGYNGPPRGIEIDWSDRDKRRERVIHAECNCLTYCKPNEIWLLASTLLPCRSCMKIIGSYSIKVVIYSEVYLRDDFSLQLAKEYGIELKQINLEQLRR